MTPLTFISLFAGIGGFDLGFARAGLHCVAQVEKDAAARSVLARHWPDVPQFDDVRDVGRHNLPAADIVCGGFPCQDLSQAGQRAGLAGARSGLFYEMVRIIDELRPAFLVWENVPGLLTSDRGRDFARVLLALDAIGYSGAWTSLDAQFFGLAQRRQRVFGVFARSDIGASCCAEVLSLANRLPWNTAPRPTARADIAASLTAGSATGSGVNQPGRRQEDDINIVVAGTLRANDHQGQRGDGADNLVVGTIGAAFSKNRGLGQENETGMLVTDAIAFAWQQCVSENDRSYIARAGDYAGAVSTSRVDAVAYSVAGHGAYSEGIGTLRASGGDVGKGSENLVVSTLTHHHGRNNDKEDTLLPIAFTERTRAEGRTLEAQEDLAYALTNPGSGGRTHSRQIAGGFGVRRLTPRECERLQGFPDDWTAGQSDSARYRQLGNAAPVPMTEWLARQFVKHAEVFL